MKKYRINERGKIQLAVVGMTIFLLVLAYGTIYGLAALMAF
mgnify:CR=1 FL=1